MRSITPIIALAIASVVSAADQVDYGKDVFPVLQKYCIGCHTADEAQGELVLETYAALMKGGEGGNAVTAGEPSSSRMIQMLTGKLEPRMPPEDEAQPTEDEVLLIASWIEQGAVGPEGDLTIRRTLRTPRFKVADLATAPATAITHSHDGKRLARATFGTVWIVDHSDAKLTVIADQPGKVNSLQFSRDGSQILIGSGLTGSYGRAAVYSVESGDLLMEFVGHRDTIYSAVFSPSEMLIATAGYDRNIILWDASTGEQLREFKGHNGAVFDLAFSPDGNVLVSACADETVKVWDVASGKRLDTLGQPEGEVFAVDVTSDGKYIVAGSADNRLRVWRLLSTDQPKINPIVATRFVDESPIVGFQLAPDGRSLVVLSESGNAKVIRTSDWNQFAVLEPLGDTGSGIAIGPNSDVAWVSLMNGDIVERKLPKITESKVQAISETNRIFLDLGDLVTHSEDDLRKKLSDASLPANGVLSVGRGVEISGAIRNPGANDEYRWQASAGEVWAIDGDKTAKSKIDPLVTILDASSNPVLRVRLQAVRDSYFTFRGKDSKQVGDFRVFNWQEMNLKQYFYANGEVTRLWMHPRGPDSGFNVYPGEGNRWTYFGTTHVAHALGEPAYIVQPLERGKEPLANGLPVFDVFYENDDDPRRIAGVNSRVVFTAPADGLYTARITDARGEGGDDFGYKLSIRPAKPGFKPSVVPVKGAIRRGSGREFTVRVDRFDEFDGPVTFEIPNLPPQIHANTPLTIEAGQRYATGALWVAEDAEDWDGKLEPEVVAWAKVAGRKVERKVGTVGVLTLGEKPSVIPAIQPLDRESAIDEDWTLVVPRGETSSARLVIKRKDGFDKEVSFGKELAGRNASGGVYVDNIGLNGLIVLKGSNERVFFVTADISAEPGRRSFFLRASVDGNVTTHPITVEVK